jgi:hypothetical protein
MKAWWGVVVFQDYAVYRQLFKGEIKATFLL